MLVYLIKIIKPIFESLAGFGKSVMLILLLEKA